jgi:hypothetical protein
MNTKRDESLIMICPHCGKRIEDITIHPRVSPIGYWSWMGGYEFKSRTNILGWPLLHIAVGINPRTGLPQVARGVIAVGNFSVGLVAVGGFALGGITFAGIGMGLLVIGGIALGGIAIGGIAIGLGFAMGGLAISARYALGGLSVVP